MLRHCVRRDSRGWLEEVACGWRWGRELVAAVFVWFVVVVVVALRRVSGRPGAEGALATSVVLVEWDVEGAMRRDLILFISVLVFDRDEMG